MILTAGLTPYVRFLRRNPIPACDTQRNEDSTMLRFESLPSRDMLANNVLAEVVPTFWLTSEPTVAPNHATFDSRPGVGILKSQDGGRTYLDASNFAHFVVDPTNPNTVYIGSANGGVWKTSNF